MKEANKMKITTDKFKVSTIFFIAYAMVVLTDMYNEVSIMSSVFNVMDFVCIGLLCLVVALDLYKKKTYETNVFILLLVFMMIIVVNSFFVDNRALVKLSFLLLAFANIQFDEFIKKDLWIRSALLGVLIVLWLLGIADKGFYEIRDGLQRMSFGAGHPNTFGTQVLFICIDLFYVFTSKNKKKTWIPILFSIGATTFLHFFVGSRTSILLIIMCIIAFIVRKHISFEKGNSVAKEILLMLLQWVSSLGFVLLCGFSWLVAVLYSPYSSVMVWLDRVFSRRLYYTHFLLGRYHVGVFGNKIDAESIFVVDNAYMNLLVRYGLIITIAFAVLFFLAIRRVFKDKNYYLAFVLIVILLYGLVESPMYIVAKNPYLLVLASGLTVRRIKNEQHN